MIFRWKKDDYWVSIPFGEDLKDIPVNPRPISVKISQNEIDTFSYKKNTWESERYLTVDIPSVLDVDGHVTITNDYTYYL